MTAARGTVRIGISGWRYPPWRGVFYPEGLPQREELAYAAGRFSSIELNGSFYGLLKPADFSAWHDATPADFEFAVKGPRYLTHRLRLKDVRQPLANFLASGPLALKRKLGPFLWQFPPQMHFDEARFEAFFALLRRHRIALVVADTAGRWPKLFDLTADFVYVRLHGDAELYASGYGDAALDDWAGRIDGWRAAGHDVYVYFDNDIKVHAPFDAQRLAERLR